LIADWILSPFLFYGRHKLAVDVLLGLGLQLWILAGVRLLVRRADGSWSNWGIVVASSTTVAGYLWAWPIVGAWGEELRSNVSMVRWKFFIMAAGLTLVHLCFSFIARGVRSLRLSRSES
jgi:hypothetical protein